MNTISKLEAKAWTTTFGPWEINFSNYMFSVGWLHGIDSGFTLL